MRHKRQGRAMKPPHPNPERRARLNRILARAFRQTTFCDHGRLPGECPKGCKVARAEANGKPTRTAR